MPLEKSSFRKLCLLEGEITCIEYIIDQNRLPKEVSRVHSVSRALVDQHSDWHILMLALSGVVTVVNPVEYDW